MVETNLCLDERCFVAESIVNNFDINWINKLRNNLGEFALQLFWCKLVWKTVKVWLVIAY